MNWQKPSAAPERYEWPPDYAQKNGASVVVGLVRWVFSGLLDFHLLEYDGSWQVRFIRLLVQQHMDRNSPAKSNQSKNSSLIEEYNEFDIRPL